MLMSPRISKDLKIAVCLIVFSCQGPNKLQIVIHLAWKIYHSKITSALIFVEINLAVSVNQRITKMHKCIKTAVVELYCSLERLKLLESCQ